MHLRPGPASGAAAIDLARVARQLIRAGVPARGAAALAVAGDRDSTVAVGRAATMLTPVLLAAGLRHRRTRPAAAALLLAEPLRSWARTRPALDPVRFAALAIADDVAYGAGDWGGAIADLAAARPVAGCRSPIGVVRTGWPSRSSEPPVSLPGEAPSQESVNCQQYLYTRSRSLTTQGLAGAHMTEMVPLNGSVFWLEEAMAVDDQPSCPPLVGPVSADVCIVGGGYLGLWTAIEILEQAPDTNVVLIEAQSCGFGASGRNGGHATGWHDELDVLIRQFGVDEGLRLAAQSSWAIDRVIDFCGEHDIDARVRRRGMVKAAVTSMQLGKWRSAVDACHAHGRGDLLIEVDGDELRRRTGSPMPLAGAVQTDGATLQPAMLVRGLRRVALELGAQIYESTPMTGLDRGTPCRVRTQAGCVTASRVVLAIGSWMGMVRELRRAFVPIGSSMIVTERLGERLTDRPFAEGQGFGDQRLSVHHMQVTTDGRLAFGRGGGPLGRAGRVDPAVMYDPRSMRSIVRDFRRWFPDLADAKIEYAWSGPVDRAPNHLPVVGKLNRAGTIHYAIGISGNGVAPCAYLGRVLGRTALGIRDADTESSLTCGPREYLPPEPFRSIGGAVVRAAVESIEDAQERGLTVNVNPVLKKLITTTTPRILEPRLWRGRRSTESAVPAGSAPQIPELSRNHYCRTGQAGEST